MSIPSEKTLSKQGMKDLIARNISTSVFAKVFNMIVRFFMPSFILAFIGLEEYGLWAICFTIISYLGLGAFGISNVYIRYCSEYHARGEFNKINGLLSTGIILVTIINLVLAIAAWFILKFIVTQVFEIKPHLQETAFILFYSTACAFLLHLVLDTFYYMLNGLQKIVETTLVMLFCLLLETVLTILFLFNGLGVYSMLYAMLIRYGVSTLLFLKMSFKFVPTLSIRPKHFSTSYFKVFYRFGAIMQLAGVLGLLANSVDKLVVSSTLGMQATALFSLGMRFPTTAQSLPASMNAVYLPAITYLYSQGRQQEVIDTYVQGSRSIALFAGFIMGFLTAFAHLLVTAWLGNKPEYQPIATIMVFTAIAAHLHTLTGPGTALFKGIDRPSNSLRLPFQRLLMMGLLLTILFNFFEATIINIAIVATLSTSISSLTYIIHNNRIIGLSSMTFFARAVLPGTVPYGIGWLFSWLLTPWTTLAMVNRWHAAGFVLFAGFFYTIITLTVIYTIIYDDNEKSRLRQQLLGIVTYVTGKINMYLQKIRKK